MAGIRATWTSAEEKRLIDNYNLTPKELQLLFPRHSQASIDRKMYRLRQKGLIGYKTKEAVSESLRQGQDAKNSK